MAADGLNVPYVLLSEDSTYLFPGSIRYQTGPGVITIDAFLMKTDTSGDILWSKTYGGIRNDNFIKSIGLPGGNYISTGYTESAGPVGTWGFSTTLYRNIFLLKSDVNGNVIQTHCLGDTLEDSAVDIIFDGNNGLTLLSSVNEHYPYLTGQMSLMQLDTNLNIQWEKSYASPDGYRLIPQRIMASTDGDFYVTGRVSYYDTLITISEVFLMKTDSLGNLQWSKMMGGNKNGDPRLLCDSNNGVYIAFTTSAYGSFMGTDFVLAYFDSSGNSTWAIRYGWLYDDWVGSFIFNPDTTAILFAAGGKILKVTLTGAIEWTNTPSYQNSFVSRSVNNRFNGGWIFPCTYQTPGPSYLSVVQIDSLGNNCEISNYTYPTQVIALQPANLNLNENTTSFFNVPMIPVINLPVVNDSLICYTYTSLEENDYYITKNSIHVNPNPVTDEFQVITSKAISERVHVLVSDAYGRIIYSNNQLPELISMKNQASGIYFISIISNNMIFSSKFIKL